MSSPSKAVDVDAFQPITAQYLVIQTRILGQDSQLDFGPMADFIDLSVGTHPIYIRLSFTLKSISVAAGVSNSELDLNVT
jgi:hypothetical protein